ncbi:MAG: 1-acyl-sn-glycerol-3-phosphate acyltransferase [Myxococcales bacterium]|nr:1-acyl-sn-glycerol-3-phosphate acyltransferase [Myxococcales bacterium]
MYSEISQADSVSHARPAGAYPNPPRGVWRALRAVVAIALGWGFLAVFLTVATTLTLLTFRYRSDRYFHLVARVVGRTVLWLQGIDLRVDNAHRIDETRSQILIFNHTSQLDVFFFTAIMPKRCVVIVKREMLWVPFIGLGVFAYRLQTIDRQNLESAKRSMAKVAAYMQANQCSVMLSPEGTRSKTEELGRFKKGAFHLAVATKAPMLPIVVRGARSCQPMGKIVADPGLVVLDVLPEVDTTEFTTEQIGARAEDMYQLFARELAA